MNRRKASAAGLILLALGGCGGAHKATEIAASGGPTSVVNLCFVLKARLEGIEHDAAFIDPQPAALEGRVPAERTTKASGEAIDTSRQTASELKAKRAPPASLQALRAAQRKYRRLARRLKGARAANGSAGLRMQVAFLTIAGNEIRGCLPPG
jgi:hypothetical protein